MSSFCLFGRYLFNRHGLSRPLPKFICVKTIVFLTFWQGLLIAFLVKAGYVRESKHRPLS